MYTNLRKAVSRGKYRPLCQMFLSVTVLIYYLQCKGIFPKIEIFNVNSITNLCLNCYVVLYLSGQFVYCLSYTTTITFKLE